MLGTIVKHIKWAVIAALIIVCVLLLNGCTSIGPSSEHKDRLGYYKPAECRDPEIMARAASGATIEYVSAETIMAEAAKNPKNRNFQSVNGVWVSPGRIMIREDVADNPWLDREVREHELCHEARWITTGSPVWHH
ncbi:MAG: hypothetical protein Unbinned664contig1000_7 [Prokaryotic dsDNA virus sp.]|nr:MAG: hypothetical protein Unbinned664contig1000_7 [Prokaryotic dsDNA virus sp.]|tara:strand:- start:26073 stop:26480 length:408 start_codon:yes stop_codon:yes gene_type:complete